MVRDILGLYLDPPERALVLCVDEKSQIQKPYRSYGFVHHWTREPGHGHTAIRNAGEHPGIM